MRIQQLTKKFKELQSGRSMVEMLGVLAIIGVLSVGGIAGVSLCDGSISYQPSAAPHRFICIIG